MRDYESVFPIGTPVMAPNPEGEEQIGIVSAHLLRGGLVVRFRNGENMEYDQDSSGTVTKVIQKDPISYEQAVALINDLTVVDENGTVYPLTWITGDDMNVYLKHNTTGEVYAVQIDENRVISASVDLYHSEITSANIRAFNFDSEPAQVEYINEHFSEFRIVTPEN